MKISPLFLYYFQTVLLMVTMLFLPFTAHAQSAVDNKTANTNADYDIQDNILVKTRDGAQISTIVVRKKNTATLSTPLPTILQFTIYVRDSDIVSLQEAADRGYVGVIAYTRGKRHSPDTIVPYTYDGRDAYDVIDWISKQTWSNGSVGMLGGSYNGFSQWAATKTLHPALKTIVPAAANRPGMGLPMENNIGIIPNYEWAFHVTNNKTIDDAVNNDRKRFTTMRNTWWTTGKPYRQLDQIDGTPNLWFQQWLDHPSYDPYWQNMVPYQNEFAQITIPILVFDGYYNDSQRSSLYYLREHKKYYPLAEDYLVIGPYGHLGAQRGGQKQVNGYEVDAVALFDIKKLTYEWMDYILKQGPKPAMLKDRINYQVMGTNTWRSAPSLEEMSNTSLKLYLHHKKVNQDYLLSEEKPKSLSFLKQTVDFKNRAIWNNNYYPNPIIRPSIDTSNGFIFKSAPIEKPLIVNGAFYGEIVASINKKDMDIGVTLYEQMPDGKYFELAYYIGRASYAKDSSTRELLEPYKITAIPFNYTSVVSRQLQLGSRLVVSINVNKNPFSELNYGTGKTVSEESILDAKTPLRVQWYNQSFIAIPVLKD